jgi:tripartite-type tricarboxylate transporter receptor subunit TctC
MLPLTRRAVVAAALLLCPAVALAQPPPEWPTKQLTIVVPFPPGGSVDTMVRLIQPGLGQALGAAIVVENKPGAQGSIGAAQVARAQPDGGSWLFVFDTHAVNPALQSLPFDTEKDLEPVLLIGTAPHILATHPSRPFKSVADVIAAAKEKSGGVTYASIGTGSLGHLTMVLLAKRAGVTLTHVAYRGGGPAMNDALAGHVDLIIGSTALVNPQVQGGGLRALVQTGTARQPALATVPTAIEAGFEGFESNAWWGIFAPKGTPAALIERFRTAAVAQMKEERIGRQLTETQQINLALGGPEALRQFLAQQMKLWGDVVRENGIKAGN